MATSYKIRLRRFNGLDYDILNLSSENIIRNNGNTVEQEFNNIIPSSNGMLKNDNGVFKVATLGSDYTAVDDSLNSSNIKTYSIDKIMSIIPVAPVGFVSYAEAQTLTDAEKSQARDNISASGTWELLWTNASPTSQFAAQTIALDLSAYSYVAIDHCNDNRNDHQIIICRKGQTARLERVAVLKKIIYVEFREAFVSETGVAFTVGTQGTNTAENATTNGGCVPNRIWGIKE